MKRLADDLALGGKPKRIRKIVVVRQQRVRARNMRHGIRAQLNASRDREIEVVSEGTSSRRHLLDRGVRSFQCGFKAIERRCPLRLWRSSPGKRGRRKGAVVHFFVKAGKRPPLSIL